MTKDIAKFKDENQISAAGKKFYQDLLDMKITSQEKFQEVYTQTAQAKLFTKAVEEYFEPMRKPAYDSYQAILAKIKQAKDYFLKAEKVGKEKISGWHKLQAKKAAEATAKAEAKAMAKAEKTGEEYVPPPAVPNKAQADGMATVENYEVEISDWMAVIKAVAAGKLPRNIVSINVGEAKRLANAAKGQIDLPGFKVYRKDIVRMKV